MTALNVETIQTASRTATAAPADASTRLSPARSFVAPPGAGAGGSPAGGLFPRAGPPRQRRVCDMGARNERDGAEGRLEQGQDGVRVRREPVRQQVDGGRPAWLLNGQCGVDG